MKRFRKRILEVKEVFLDAKIKNVAEACILVNIFVISFIAVVILCLLTIFIKFNLNNIFYITSSILLVSDIFFLFNFRAFVIVLSFSTKILLHFFGRYGRVVTKNDWTRIKKEYPKVYRKI